jgi:hypothetical protein
MAAPGGLSTFPITGNRQVGSSLPASLEPSPGKHRPLRAADSGAFARKSMLRPLARFGKFSLAANHGISLDLNLGVGNRKRSNGD